MEKRPGRNLPNGTQQSNRHTILDKQEYHRRLFRTLIAPSSSHLSPDEQHPLPAQADQSFQQQTSSFEEIEKAFLDTEQAFLENQRAYREAEESYRKIFYDFLEAKAACEINNSYAPV